jgi:hypothetical protein
MSRVATQLGKLRDAVGEICALVGRVPDSLDHSGADHLLVELLAYVLGEVARSATAAASKLDGQSEKLVIGWIEVEHPFSEAGAGSRGLTSSKLKGRRHSSLSPKSSGSTAMFGFFV